MSKARSFQNEADILQGIKDAEDQLQRMITKECDWTDPEDRRGTRTDQRAAIRREELDHIAPERICPRCENRFLRSRSWVVVGTKSHTEKRIAICRTCFFRLQMSEKVHRLRDLMEFNEGLFSEPVSFLRFGLNGARLVELRFAVGMGAAEFARRAGWSRSYQRKLEQSTISVSEETKEVVLQVLRESGEVGEDE